MLRSPESTEKAGRGGHQQQKQICACGRQQSPKTTNPGLLTGIRWPAKDKPPGSTSPEVRQTAPNHHGSLASSSTHMVCFEKALERVPEVSADGSLRFQGPETCRVTLNHDGSPASKPPKKAFPNPESPRLAQQRPQGSSTQEIRQPTPSHHSSLAFSSIRPVDSGEILKRLPEVLADGSLRSERQEKCLATRTHHGLLASKKTFKNEEHVQKTKVTTARWPLAAHTFQVSGRRWRQCRKFRAMALCDSRNQRPRIHKLGTCSGSPNHDGSLACQSHTLYNSGAGAGKCAGSFGRWLAAI